jgi:hypothetical protein
VTEGGWIPWGKHEVPPEIRPHEMIDLITCEGWEHHGFSARGEFMAWSAREPYVAYYRRHDPPHAPTSYKARKHSLPLPESMLNHRYQSPDWIDALANYTENWRG